MCFDRVQPAYMPDKMRRKCQIYEWTVSRGRVYFSPLVSAKAAIPPNRPKVERKSRNISCVFGPTKGSRSIRYIGILQSWKGKYHQ
ncbi:hypothetical protein [Mediterraneibacter massiliensis]